VRAQVAALFADTQFNFGTRLIAKSMAARGSGTWRYLFTRRPPGQADGPHHAGEVPYVFGTLAKDGAQVPAADELLSQAMRSAWVAFARNGEPGAVSGHPWRRYDAAQDNYLAFGDTVAEGSGWRAAQLDFLDRFQSA
jgi:carboxylesterase type B